MSSSVIRDKSKILLLTVILIAVVEGIVIGILWSKFDDLRKQVPYSFHERTFVNRSVQAFADDQKLPPATVMQGRFPVVARTREGRCVNIRNLQGSIGSIAIYCFDYTGNLVYRDQR